MIVAGNVVLERMVHLHHKCILIKDMRFGIFALALGLILLLAAAGTVIRKSWYDILGIILCIISLIGFPIGTLLGIWGLTALNPNNNLFGKQRYFNKDISREYKLRRN